MQALSTTVPGHSYTIKWMFGLPEVIDFIKNCQIEEGCLIHVLQKSSAGLIIKSKDHKLAISNDIADRIQV